MKLTWLSILFTFIATNCIMSNRIQGRNWHDLASVHYVAAQNADTKPSSTETEKQIFLKIDQVIQKGDLDALRKLIANGFPLDIRNEFKWTPLMIAVREKNVEVVKILLDSGANINVRAESGLTPLMLALALKNKEIALELLNRGADINIKDEKGNTALTKASMHCDGEIVQALIYRGADINNQNEDGATPLMLSNIRTVDALLKGGAKINLVDMNGDSAIMYAIVEGLLPKIQSLISYSADVNMKAKDGRTPLQFAYEKHFSEAVEALKQAGARK